MSRDLRGGFYMLRDEDGYYTDLVAGKSVRRLVNTHPPERCATRLCDIHGRSGKVQSSPIVWGAEGKNYVQYFCEHDVLHPTPAHMQYRAMYGIESPLEHRDCDGCCAAVW